ncbi:MAG: IclR family transcriptional regulator [Alphaproteobacteria bacterium]|nr:IclR family transcriptional regulator [Alphaproteobacteria bacterium]
MHTANEAREKGKPVGALVAGLKVLRHLNVAEDPQGVSQVARATGLNVSTCFNLLRTMLRENLVAFDPAAKTYTPDFGLAELAHRVLGQSDLLRRARPELARLAAEHGVTAVLWQRVAEDRVMMVERADADSPLRVYMPIGQRLPSLIGSMGRCIAATDRMTKDVVRERFRALRWHSAPSFSEYWADIEAARRTGWAVDQGNYHRGVTTVGAAIVDSLGRAVGAISTVDFRTGTDARSIARLGADLRSTAERLSEPRKLVVQQSSLPQERKRA